jgi:hypothetical protein
MRSDAQLFSKRAILCNSGLPVLAAVLLAASPGRATPLTLYMAPRTSVLDDCRSAATACPNLARIQRVVQAVNPQDNVTVNIAVGTYVQQSVIWTYVMPTHTVTFLGAGSGTANIPVFDNCSNPKDVTTCRHNVWFKFHSAAVKNGGQYSNLVIDHLEVKHYGEAIWLVGDRSDKLGGWNGANIITNCVFAYDGNFYDPSLPESWAVIRLYNSRWNQITNNLFEHIWGVSGNVYLHALYLASWADNNVISGNTFWDVAGDTIRFRDASNWNSVSLNNFEKTGEDAPITSWFCHPYSQSGCGKTIPECPSTGNAASSNYYTGGDRCPAKPPPFTANLYGVSACGVSLSQQNIAVSRLRMDFSACHTGP